MLKIYLESSSVPPPIQTSRTRGVFLQLLLTQVDHPVDRAHKENPADDITYGDGD